MNASNLPEGARLALMNWPGGHLTCRQIADAAGKGTGRRWATSHVAVPLRQAGLIEWNEAGTRNRLTQAGRKAWDVLQSGVE